MQKWWNALDVSPAGFSLSLNLVMSRSTLWKFPFMKFKPSERLYNAGTHTLRDTVNVCGDSPELISSSSYVNARGCSDWVSSPKPYFWVWEMIDGVWWDTNSGLKGESQVWPSTQPWPPPLLTLSRFGKYIAARRLFKSSEGTQMALGCRYILAWSQRTHLVHLEGDPWQNDIWAAVERTGWVLLFLLS